MPQRRISHSSAARRSSADHSGERTGGGSYRSRAGMFKTSPVALSTTLGIRLLLRLVVHHADRHGTAVLACDLLLLAVHRVMRLEKELQNVGVEADSQVPRDLAQVVDRVRNRRVPLSTECRIPLALV